MSKAYKANSIKATLNTILRDTEFPWRLCLLFRINFLTFSIAVYSLPSRYRTLRNTNTIGKVITVITRPIAEA